MTIASATLLAACTLPPCFTVAYLSPHLWKRAQVRSLRVQCRRTRSLVLTYDDGPGPGVTPRVLDCLDSFGATATFFVLGAQVDRNRAVFSRVVESGHEIGTHSYDHLHAWRANPRSVVASFERGCDAIGRSERPLFRPPYGKLTFPLWSAVHRRRGTIAWWTTDSGDTWRDHPTVESVAENVRRNQGGVVLLHDFDRDERFVRHMLDVTAALLVLAEQEGLRVCRFSELTGVVRTDDSDVGAPMVAKEP